MTYLSIFLKKNVDLREINIKFGDASTHYQVRGREVGGERMNVWWNVLHHQQLGKAGNAELEESSRGYFHYSQFPSFLNFQFSSILH